MNVVRIVGGVFAVAGLVLAIAAGAIYQRNSTFAAAARPAAGLVVDLVPSSNYRSRGDPRTYVSVVRFATAQGRIVEFADDVASHPPRHDQGQQVRVLYDPANPTKAVIDDFGGRWAGLAIVGGLAAVFAPLGLTLLAVSFQAARRRTRLEREGRPIDAAFLHVFRDESLTINGDHPFRVAAQGVNPKTGKLRRFIGPPMWVDPTRQLEGKTVRVLLGERKQYRIDLRGVVDDAELAE